MAKVIKNSEMQIEILDWDYDEVGTKHPFNIQYRTPDNEGEEYEDEFLTSDELADILKHLLLIEDYQNGAVSVKFFQEQLPNGSYEHTQKETIGHCSMTYFMDQFMTNQAFVDIAICIEQQKAERQAAMKKEASRISKEIHDTLIKCFSE